MIWLRKRDIFQFEGKEDIAGSGGQSAIRAGKVGLRWNADLF